MKNEIPIGLTVLEAAWLVQKTEAEIGSLMKRGILRVLEGSCLLDVVSVRGLITEDDWLAEEALELLLAGELIAPRPNRRWGRRSRSWDTSCPTS